MVDNQIEKVNNQKENNKDLEEALSIAYVVFYSHINKRDQSFNFSKFQAINKTVETGLEMYGIEAFRHMHQSMMKQNPDNYGFYYFTPKNLLNWLDISYNKVSEYQDEIINKEDVKNEIYSAHNLIPDTFDNNKRATPNVFLRSALFGIVRKGRREMVKNQLIESMGQYEVFFTGEQLDQNDLVVWDALTYLAKTKNVENELKTSIYEICKIVNIINDKKNRESIKTRIKRLVIANIEIKQNKKFYFGSLIDDFYFNEQDAKSVVRFNKKLLSIFDNKDYTLGNKKILDSLGVNQLSSWLFRFYETHQNPIPFKIEYLKKLCGSDTEFRDFKRKLKIACSTLKKVHEENNLVFDYKFTEDNYLSVSTANKQITKS